MEIKDNTFARQFETKTKTGIIAVEYSFQEKKIFLTKINTPENHNDEEFISHFLKNIMESAIEKKLKVVPIHPKIVAFFKKNPIYKELLPPGIRI
ncbi:N-acetyltransferase [Flavobacterium sp. HJJ]|nr:N-acetyltransferase [Flavobacterium sp. HJJ]